MKPHQLLSGLLCGASLALIAPGVGMAQGPIYANQADLGGLTRGLADRVRHLGEDIAAELGQNPGVQHMLEDTQELAITVDEFGQTLQSRPDPNQVAQAHAAIETTWQHLRAQLTRPGASTDGVNRAIVRVDEMLVQVRQAVQGNPPPPAYNGYGPPPTGVAETQRLAHALVSRAQGLATAIRIDMAGDPNGEPFARDADQLTQAADRFHDAIDANQPIEVAAQAFGPVDQIADHVEKYATSGRVPPRVQQAWQAFASVEALIHQNLGLNSPQPTAAYVITAPAGGGPSPIVGLADRMAEQINAYIATFNKTARGEPEGLAALSDAQRLLQSTANFRQVAAQGAPPNQLAYEFREVDADWQRLARRAARIARGRNGPYVQQVRAIGGTSEQIHAALGMIGYPPTFEDPVGNVPPPPPPGSGQFR
ncbi:hypothetical protein TA3x_002417 [Tundrisphaera sp. TA3]|uniref:hypothetical protein n=1 Tax=Tundrisphaera sp. TA3 TaxID=3435775 RepID=UPI003EB75CAF